MQRHTDCQSWQPWQACQQIPSHASKNETPGYSNETHDSLRKRSRPYHVASGTEQNYVSFDWK